MENMDFGGKLLNEFNLKSCLCNALWLRTHKTSVQQELEKQMSPSKWNPHKTPEQVIDEYVNVTSSGKFYAYTDIA